MADAGPFECGCERLGIDMFPSRWMCIDMYPKWILISSCE